MLEDLLQNFLKKLDSKAAPSRARPSSNASKTHHSSNSSSFSNSSNSSSFHHSNSGNLSSSANSSSFHHSPDSSPDIPTHFSDSTTSFSSHQSHDPEPVFTPEKEVAPQTLPEFVELIKNTPKSVLSTRDRKRIAAVMTFDDRTVRDVMVPKRKMIFVKDTEILGPLTLDKLYQSGFNIFPVVDSSNHVLGVIHTEALNALEIRDTDRATKYLDTVVQYLHTTDSLKFAISEIERTNNYYFLVLDELETLAGFFTIQQLLDYLLGN